MRFLFTKPHLFISYTQKDRGLAEYLFNYLTKVGFSVYYDKEKTLVGENFVSEIVHELRRTDAVVALISTDSAASVWCQAELYHAHALRKIIAPIHIGLENPPQAAPLDILQREFSYVVVSNNDNFSTVAAQIEKRLNSVRWKSYFRSIRNTLLLVFALIFIVLIWKFGIQNINSINRANERRALIERLKNSNETLASDVVNTYAKNFSEDEALISELLLMQSNNEFSDNARLNAHLLSSALLAPRKSQQRWYIENINWQNSNLQNSELSDITFRKGNINNVNFDGVTFSGVIWNQAPSKNAEGLMLSDLKFNNCEFYFGWYVGTGAIKVDFINSSFRGARFDVSGFNYVNFASRVSDPSSEIITNEITVFENSTIENCVEPTPPGVMEITPEGSEVNFDGVTFNSCHFRGRIKPEWFKNSRFINCVFPKSFSKSALESNENTIENYLTTIQEGCD